MCSHIDASKLCVVQMFDWKNSANEQLKGNWFVNNKVSTLNLAFEMFCKLVRKFGAVGK